MSLHAMRGTFSESKRTVSCARPGRVGAGVQRVGARGVVRDAGLGPDDFVTIMEAPDHGRLEGGERRQGKNKRA